MVVINYLISLKKNKDFINTTQKLIDGGMAEKKAIQSSLEKHFGGEMYHKLWKHVAPTTKVESGYNGEFIWGNANDTFL